MSLSTSGELTIDDWEVIDRLCDKFEQDLRLDQTSDLDSIVSSAPARLHEQLRSELERVQQDLCPDQAMFDRVCDEDGTRLSQRDESDTVRLGRFILTGKLGSGASSVVWKAVDTGLDRWVAIKIPHQKGFVDSGRFLREARLSARLQHPNVVSVLEVHQKDDRCFLVNEFVEGVSLERQLNGPVMDFQDVAAMLAMLADALAHCHDRGVIHRDLKPHNVLVDSAGIPHVIDFGLAAQAANDSSSITKLGQPVGTPAYMAPEQVDPTADSVSQRTDIYAIGVTLYRMLTQQLPFRGSIDSVFHQIVSEKPTPPRMLNPQVPRDLETICLKCLEKAPDDRFASAGQLRDELNRFIGGLPIDSRPLSAVGLSLRWARRNKRLATLALSTAACLVCIAVGSTVAAIQLRESWQREHDLRVLAIASQNRADANAVQAAAEATVSRESFEFLRGVFESSDPATQTIVGVYGDEQPETMRDVLELATRRVDSGALKQPEVKATLMDLLGNAWRGLGDFDQADRLLRGAANYRQQSNLDDANLRGNHRRARNLFYRAWLQHDRGDYKAAESHYRLARDLALASEPTDDLFLSDIEFQHGRLLTTIGRSDEATPLFVNSLDLRKKHLPAESRRIAVARIGVAVSQTDGSFESIARLMPLIAGDDRAAQIGLKYLQTLHLRAVGDYDSASRLQAGIVTEVRQMLGENHPLYLFALGDFASTAQKCGNFQVACDAACETIEKATRLAPHHPKLREVLLQVGEEMLRAGRLEEATRYFRQAMEIKRPGTPRFPYGVHIGLAWSELKAGQAEHALESSQRIMEHLNDYPTEMAAWACHTHARILHACGRPDEAPAHDEKALVLAEHCRARCNHPTWLANLGRVYLHANDAEAAEQLFRRAIELERPRWPGTHPRVAARLVELADALSVMNRQDEAEQILDEALKIYREKLPEDDKRISLVETMICQLASPRSTDLDRVVVHLGNPES